MGDTGISMDSVGGSYDDSGLDIEDDDEYEYLTVPDEEFLDEAEVDTSLVLNKIPFTRIHEPPLPFDSPQNKCFLPGQKIQVNIVEVETADTGLFNPNLYVIQLKHGDYTWTIRRRYKHFRALHDSLVIFRAKSKIPVPTKTQKQRRKSFATRKHTIPKFPKTPEPLVRNDNIEQRKQQLEDYLQTIVRFPQFRNHIEMRKFLEVSALSFVFGLGDKRREGVIQKRAGGRRIKITMCGCCPSCHCTAAWDSRWLIMKDSFLAYVNPKNGIVGDVILVDRDFEVQEGLVHTGVSHGLLISNLSRHLLMKCQTHRMGEEWFEDIQAMLSEGGKQFKAANRFHSFAPVRPNSFCNWFVDGANYMAAVADALEGAKEEIFITDWWLSPEVYMKRPITEGEKWRLDIILKRKAEQGVRIYVLVYKELEMALGINSYYTKQALVKQHPNIKVLRHPDGITLWSHHEKIVAIDQRIAFLGGIDLCYGRWDTGAHRLTDLGALTISSDDNEGNPLAVITEEPEGLDFGPSLEDSVFSHYGKPSPKTNGSVSSLTPAVSPTARTEPVETKSRKKTTNGGVAVALATSRASPPRRGSVSSDSSSDSRSAGDTDPETDTFEDSPPTGNDYLNKSYESMASKASRSSKASKTSKGSSRMSTVASTVSSHGGFSNPDIDQITLDEATPGSRRRDDVTGDAFLLEKTPRALLEQEHPGKPRSSTVEISAPTPVSAVKAGKKYRSAGDLRVVVAGDGTYWKLTGDGAGEGVGAGAAGGGGGGGEAGRGRGRGDVRVVDIPLDGGDVPRSKTKGKAPTTPGDLERSQHDGGDTNRTHTTHTTNGGAIPKQAAGPPKSRSPPPTSAGAPSQPSQEGERRRRKVRLAETHTASHFSMAEDNSTNNNNKNNNNTHKDANTNNNAKTSDPDESNPGGSRDDSRRPVAQASTASSSSASSESALDHIFDRSGDELRPTSFAAYLADIVEQMRAPRMEHVTPGRPATDSELNYTGDLNKTKATRRWDKLAVMVSKGQGQGSSTSSDTTPEAQGPSQGQGKGRTQAKRPPKLALNLKHFGKGSAFEEDVSSPSDAPSDRRGSGASSPEPDKAVHWTSTPAAPGARDGATLPLPGVAVVKPSTPPTKRKAMKKAYEFKEKFRTSKQMSVDVTDDNFAYPWNESMYGSKMLNPHEVLEEEGLEGEVKLWIGKDYVNFIHKDFVDLDKPFTDMVDRTKTPRMPWHDIGAVVAGKAARDAARHFIQRWNYTKLSKQKMNPDYPMLLPKSYSKVSLPTWIVKESYMANCQIVRSSSEWSAGIQHTEHSIQEAYVDLILSSKHYIYIENQFFVTIMDDNVVENQIARALYERIVDAHKKKQPFRVYVVMPLLPAFEGEIGTTTGTSIQAVTHWNYSSICRGGKSLLERLTKTVKDPFEYVSFFGLRTHDMMQDRLATELVYVHSKLMIVDDMSVIIGSANINDRSLMGKRDSEIAIVVQDTKTVPSRMAGKEYNAGIYASSLRKTIFREHMGVKEDDPLVDVTDPVCSEFYKGIWLRQASVNTTVYEQVFNCVPSDKTRTYLELKAFQKEIPMATTNPEKAKKLLKKVSGHLVLMPLLFLAHENLGVLRGKEGLMPNVIWT